MFGLEPIELSSVQFSRAFRQSSLRLQLRNLISPQTIIIKQFFTAKQTRLFGNFKAGNQLPLAFSRLDLGGN